MPYKIITSKLIKIFLTVLICLLLIFINPANFFNPIRGIFLRISYPIQKISYIISGKTRNFFSILSSISEFKKEKERLVMENNRLSSMIAELKDQKKENEVLRQQLGLLPKNEYFLEASFVVSQDPRGSGSWIMIDKGKSSGIREGMPAIISEGVLVGKVSEVFERNAKINLLTDSISSVNVVDLETGAKGILLGEYGLGLVMGMVSQTDVLNVGDEIITSGLGGVVPRGFLIGKIQEIKNTQDKLFQEAIVIPKVKYSDLNIVFIVKEKNN